MKVLVFAIAMLVALVVAMPTAAFADRYYIDSAVFANSQQVKSTLSPDGGRIDLPAAGGVSAHLTYPKNDAPPGTSITVTGIGPAGVDHMHNLDTVFTSGWRPFYYTTIRISPGEDARWITFHGFPTLKLDIPDAKEGSIYYGDLCIETGNTVHFPLGPPNEFDSKHITFNFDMLVQWAIEDGNVRVPLGPIIRLIAARQ